MKFTPGPWTVEPFLTPEYDDDPMGVYKVQPAFDELTELYEKMDPEEDGDFYEKVHDVNQANAHLIAAAPYLLAALEYAMLLIAENPGASEMYRASAEKKSRDAINKARGQA